MRELPQINITVKETCIDSVHFCSPCVEIIGILWPKASTKNTQVIHVPFPGAAGAAVTFRAFLQAAQNSVPAAKYFPYDGFTNNCQHFIQIVLVSGHIKMCDYRSACFVY